MHRKKFKTMDAYIKDFPKDVQGKLNKIRMTIRKAVPGVVETISYSIPTFNLNGKYLLYCAAFTHHIGLYPIPKAKGVLGKALLRYRAGKGTLRFPLDKPIPYGIVKSIALSRVKERQEQSKG